MAGNLLMSISQDERERAIFRSRRKFQTDLQSDLATAEDRGRNLGRQEGRLEGRLEGRQEGKLEGKLEVARKLLRRNRPIDEIMEDTGLSHEEIANIHDSIR